MFRSLRYLGAYPQGKYEDAEQLYRRAMEIVGETLGEEHPTYSIKLSKVAELLQKQVRASVCRGACGANPAGIDVVPPCCIIGAIL